MDRRGYEIHVSIHAPREGSDRLPAARRSPSACFYPRSPRGERRLQAWVRPVQLQISIHAPREGSDLQHLAADQRVLHISIHAPREGSDLNPRTQTRYPSAFLSTLPARGATVGVLADKGDGAISIHAPREGSDSGIERFFAFFAYFYPRSPRGERPWTSSRQYANREFLSTLPARGATVQPDVHHVGVVISIHAPREGSDQGGQNTGDQISISIHAPREGSDNSRLALTSPATSFLSTLPARGATRGQHQDSPNERISIHAPREGSDRYR